MWRWTVGASGQKRHSARRHFQSPGLMLQLSQTIVRAGKPIYGVGKPLIRGREISHIGSGNRMQSSGHTTQYVPTSDMQRSEIQSE